MFTDDRLLGAIRAIIRAELPRLSYLGVYEYVIQRAGDNVLDAEPASTLGLPAVRDVPLVSTLLGARATPLVGATCRIRFINGSPTRPVCTGIGSVPSSASVDASGTFRLGPGAVRVTLAGGSAGVAREGDSVTFFLPSSAVFTGTVTLAGGGTAPLAGTLAVLNGMSGIIASGSPNVGTS
jgi:hypothetical protein